MTDEQNQVENRTWEISLLELVHVIVMRKMLIIKICSVAALAAIVYSLTLPNIYSATAKVLPPQKESAGGLSAMLGGQLAALTGSGLGGGSDLYLGILKSRSVGDAVIQRLDLTHVYKSKTLEAARNRLNVAVKAQVGKDGIISITAEDKDPKFSAVLANAFVDELGKTTVRLNLSKAGTERSFLEKRLDLVKKDLKAAEDELKSFAQSNKIAQVDSQASASIAAIARMRAELASKEVQLAVLLSTQTDQSPEVQGVQTGIRRLKGELAALTGNHGNGEGLPSIGNVPSVGLEYSRKLRELKTQEAIFEQLTKQYELAKINEAKDSSSFQVLDDAVAPVNKSKPARSLIVILAAVAGFFVAISVILVQEFLTKMSDRDKKIVDDIKKHAFAFK